MVEQFNRGHKNKILFEITFGICIPHTADHDQIFPPTENYKRLHDNKFPKFHVKIKWSHGPPNS
jgi:hypothetical protein